MNNASADNLPSPNGEAEKPSEGFLGISLTFLAVTAVAYIVIDSEGPSDVHWANKVGESLACGVLSLACAIVLMALVNGFPKSWKLVKLFAPTLIVPTLACSGFWLWRACDVAEKSRFADREAKERREEFQKKAKLNVAARPIIEVVRIGEEEGIKEMLRGSTQQVEVEGWSATKVGESKWLVRFILTLDGEKKWIVFEHDSYLGATKSVLGDDVLKKRYYIEQGGPIADWSDPIK